jgi:hypothetical protein
VGLILPVDPASGILSPGLQQTRNPRYFAVPQGLVGYWALDPDTLDFTNNLVLDLSGNDLTATRNGTPPLANAQVGTGLSFGTTGNYLSVPTNAVIPTGNSARSVSFWFFQRTRVNNVNSAVLDILNGGSGQGFVVQVAQLSATVNLFTDGVNAGNNVNIGIGPPLNQWHHIVFTYGIEAGGISTWRYFLNGTQVSTGAFGTAINTNASGINIGRRSSGATGYMDAILDEVRLYNRAIEPSEVISLYQAGLMGQRAAGSLPELEMPLLSPPVRGGKSGRIRAALLGAKSAGLNRPRNFSRRSNARKRKNKSASGSLPRRPRRRLKPPLPPRHAEPPNSGQKR